MLQWRKQDIEPIVDSAKPAAIKIIEQEHEHHGLFTNLANDWYVRPAMILTAFALFCGLMFNAAIALWNTLDQPIQKLSITGNTQYIDKNMLIEKLITQMRPSDNSDSMLALDIQEIQQLTLEEPWVNNAAIKRVWPPELRVNIQEQVPIAKWGKKGLLNHQGDIFWPQQRDQLEFLPILNGPSTDTARVMDQYHTLSRFFKGSDSYMQGLSLQDRGAWTLLLNNEIEVELGREKILARLRRFLQLYKGHLYLKADQIARVDVRYTNGVAVKWRAQALEAMQVQETK
ncbi:MAG: cell division protein FtsQ [Oceanospirillaceae bacterium]|jgi:cell division protein FtsQ